MICPTGKAEYFSEAGWTEFADLPVEAEQLVDRPSTR
jgi:hypothetical protein